MSSGRLRNMFMLLSILLVVSGITTAVAGFSAPKITIITSGPGQPVKFRIHFYLLWYEDQKTPDGPSTANSRLWKIELPNGIYPAPAIRVWDPDGVEYQWVGPPVPIVVQKPGVGPTNPGADVNYYVDVIFDPSKQDGWSRVPNTSKTGLYKVDFDGRIFLSTGGEQPFTYTQYFDIEYKFYVPEISSVSVALILSGVVMLVLRKLLVK